MREFYVIGGMKQSPLRTFLLQLYVAFLLLGFLFVPAAVYASHTPEVAAWVPWWSGEAGAERALEQIDEIDILYPFVFEMNADGELVNKVDFADDHWDDLFDEARRERVDILPTIAWFDGEAIDEVLSDRRKRARHINEIVDMVRDNRFDGVNIDYEQKLAKTIDNYSLFLKELEDKLGQRDLSCTIEARMRPERRWREMPAVIEYANDYKAMNRYCDWVDIMAYDQQRADIYMNNERRGVPYNPVADTEWVEHVVEFALEDFDADKVLLGAPTYGRAWDVTVAADWYKDYTSVASLNYPRIVELSKKYDAPIGRTAGGEGVITYFPEDSPWTLLNQLPTPQGTPKGYEAAAKALMVATYADIEIPVRFVSFSNAASFEEKLDLVAEYDLRGIAIFKVDGEEGEDLWDLF